MDMNFTMNEYFDEYNTLKLSYYQWYRSEYRRMKENFLNNNLDEALVHENNIMFIVGFIDNQTIKEDIEYELYKSQYTQLKHPFRKRTGIYARYEQCLKNGGEIDDEEEYE